MVVALEPMINQGTRNIKQLKDGGHFNCRRKTICTEHDIALVDGKPELLSTFAYIYKALGIVSSNEG
jgi:methionyl aminopeptidase